jgi:hypothetical protein
MPSPNKSQFHKKTRNNKPRECGGCGHNGHDCRNCPVNPRSARPQRAQEEVVDLYKGIKQNEEVIVVSYQSFFYPLVQYLGFI